MLSATHFFFFFNDTATTEIYTLSLHDALPISPTLNSGTSGFRDAASSACVIASRVSMGSIILSIHKRDRKSTRLNSSHGYISYAVFCLKKKKTNGNATTHPAHMRLYAP